MKRKAVVVCLIVGLGVLASIYSRFMEQRFTYVVKDVYGTKVIPENLGKIATEPFQLSPARFPTDIIQMPAASRSSATDSPASTSIHSSTSSC
jgi:hypothetical protein